MHDASEVWLAQDECCSYIETQNWLQRVDD